MRTSQKHHHDYLFIIFIINNDKMNWGFIKFIFGTLDVIFLRVHNKTLFSVIIIKNDYK